MSSFFGVLYSPTIRFLHDVLVRSPALTPEIFMLDDSDSSKAPWLNEAYSIKRHGASITNCDDEPIHTPGCIQAHGAILVLRPSDLQIMQVSENSLIWLGIPPEALLGKPLSVAVGAQKQEQVRECLAQEPLECNPLHVFTVPKPQGNEFLDVCIHTLGSVAILEFEQTDRSAFEVEKDYFTLLKSTLSRLHAASNLQHFCEIVTSEVRNLTGLDRVMIYRFHPDYHGEVYAESKRDDLPPWLGLHYPAQDIPKPARDIFKKIWIRPLPDAHAAPVELVPLVNPDNGFAPDLTYCALRGASVMYTEYLQNMGVAASLTMPILRNDELFGLIACHHYQPIHFPYQMRASCEFLAQAASLQIKTLEDRDQLLYRLKLDSIHGQLINSLAATESKLEDLIAGYPNLLNGLEANGVALFHQGRWCLCGRTPDERQLDGLANWLEGRSELSSPTRPIYFTDQLARDYPDGHAFKDTASGLIALSLSRQQRLLLLWFRGETIQFIHWAGSPHDKPTVPGPNGPRLTPRASFDLFVESVKERSLPWKNAEVEAVLLLRNWMTELIIGRGERLAALNADLVRSNHDLDAFAYVVSHDLKEPLRGITNHAQALLKDAETLSEAQQLCVNRIATLTQRMDTLLNGLLRFSRIGRSPLEMATVNLGEVIEEALKMVGVHRFQIEIVIPRTLPAVVCDRLRIREVFCCLLDNALKYNQQNPRRVEIGYVTQAELAPSQQDHDRPVTTYYIRDNGIGIEPQFHSRIFDLFRRLHPREAYAAGAGTGLAITRLLIERHNGRIWVESIPGQGSTFYFTLGHEAVDMP